MWIEGTTSNNQYIRRSLKTSSWEKASLRLRAIEEEGSSAPETQHRVTLESAMDEYLEDARVRGLVESSLRQFESIYRNQFLAWCKAQNYKYVNEIDLAALRSLRKTWDGYAPRTKHTKQVRLKQFFRFCLKSKWIKENPIAELSRIRVAQKPTDYFRPVEIERLLSAALQFDRLNGHRGGKRLYALILLMRWSGLRITDAVTLERARIADGDLMLYQAKTGLPVRLPLPGRVLAALAEMPAGLRPNLRYFFWSGNGDHNGAADVMHKAFRKVARLALPEKRSHPHMLRDTFAIEMLLAGVPLDQVSILLGHSSVTMTEKHYAPWVKARQDQLAANVRSAWSS